MTDRELIRHLLAMSPAEAAMWVGMQGRVPRSLPGRLAWLEAASRHPADGGRRRPFGRPQAAFARAEMERHLAEGRDAEARRKARKAGRTKHRRAA